MISYRYMASGSVDPGGPDLPRNTLGVTTRRFTAYQDLWAFRGLMLVRVKQMRGSFSEIATEEDEEQGNTSGRYFSSPHEGTQVLGQAHP